MHGRTLIASIRVSVIYKVTFGNARMTLLKIDTCLKKDIVDTCQMDVRIIYSECKFSKVFSKAFFGKQPIFDVTCIAKKDLKLFPSCEKYVNIVSHLSPLDMAPRASWHYLLGKLYGFIIFKLNTFIEQNPVLIQINCRLKDEEKLFRQFDL